MTRVATLFAALMLAVTTLGASGASDPAAAPRAKRPPIGGPGETVDVRVGDNTFRPKKLKVLPGTTVRWTNLGANEHNVVPNKGKRFGIDELAPDQEYSYTFESPGKFAYYCSFHGAPGIGQHGRVKVVEPRAERDR